MQLPTIIDNKDNNTVLEALKKLLPESKSLDVATGYFEIGSLLALDSFWNQLAKIRIVMGDETTKRTRRELLDVIKKGSNDSIENEKVKDDSLAGLLAVRKALENNLIDTKVYTKAKFHAKALLMQMKPPHLSNYGIIGSSNFTEAGLNRNLELNVLTTEKLQLDNLKQWYELVYSEAEEIKDEIINVIEPHIKLYSPFEVYVKALYEYFLGEEVPTTAWEETQSQVYPILDDLQKIGYHQALWIAQQWGGALICDGVGFGKTYIGLMLIERFLYERKRILLIVPKSARESVWERRLEQYLSYDRSQAFGQQIEILNHTDLHREKLEDKINRIKELADVILIDEAHHFRTPAAQRSEKLFEMIESNGKKKQVYMLTATPVNNSLFDILHLIEYFSRKDRKYFQKLGINDTRFYFIQKEKAVAEKMGIRANAEETLFPELDAQEVEKILKHDTLFKEVIIQRSREFAKKYFAQKGDGQFFFPERDAPKVANYKLAKVYGDLFNRIKESFNKQNPFLELLIYNPESKRKEKDKADPFVVNREVQVISLIRGTFLKRMESSYKAFESSCEDLLRKMARFLRYYDEVKWNTWKKKNDRLWEKLEMHWKERYADYYDVNEIEEVEEDDILPEPKEKLSSDEFFIPELVGSVEKDMTQLAGFLQFIYSNITEKTDDKLKALLQLLQSKDLNGKKVIIFTEYRDTARYIYNNLISNNLKGNIEQLDSTSNKDREEVIKRFAPYYNCDNEELPKYLKNQIQILISTDVLSEGLNLQDANLLINYDLHWNPVRLMQRIGRVDRRIDPEKEKLLHRDKNVIKFWNFLPPDELDDLLDLYNRVHGKVLRISKVLGIEGKKLLKPEDDYEALKDFNATYNGVLSFEEHLRLIYEAIIKEHPDLAAALPNLPKRLFSGQKKTDVNSGIFAAYRYPHHAITREDGKEEEIPGECIWYFYDKKNDDVIEGVEAIHRIIECNSITPREVSKPVNELRQYLKIIEQRNVQKYLRQTQATVDEKPTLMCWMEIN